MSDGAKKRRIHALEKFKEVVDLRMQELPEDQGIESMSVTSLERSPVGPGGHSRGGLHGGDPVRGINAVGHWRRVQISVDSGAEPIAGPGDLCQDFAEFVPHDAARDGVCCWAPGDLAFPSTPSEGTKTFKVLTNDVPRAIVSHIAPNGKPLIYVDDTDDKGCDTFFPSNGQAMDLPQASGEMARVRRTGGRFEFDAEALPPTQCPPAGRGVDL